MSEDTTGVDGSGVDTGSQRAAPASGGGTPAPAFVETLATEYRDAIQRTGISDANALANAYLNAQSALGKSIRIPGADAGADDVTKFEQRLAEKVPGLVKVPKEGDTAGWQTFYQRLGTPETPDGYKFAAVEDVPDHVVQPIDNFLKPLLHSAHITAGQAATVREALIETQRAAHAQSQAQLQAAQSALQEKWGAGYDQRFARASGVVNKLLPGEDGDQLRAALDAAGLGNVPQLLQLLDRVADFTSEDAFVQGARPNSGIPDTLGELDAQLAEISRNPAYHNNRDPLNKSLVQKALNLHEQRAAMLKRDAA